MASGTRSQTGADDLKVEMNTLKSDVGSVKGDIKGLNARFDELETMLQNLSKAQNASASSSTAPSSVDPTSTTTASQKKGPLHFLRGPAQDQNEERFEDGAINLHRNKPRAGAETEYEERLKDAWPEAILPSEAKGFPHCERKNRVAIPSNLRLVWADETVLDKLREIQHRLRQALVPYELWSQRVSSELAGDFQQVANFVRLWDPPWIVFLEAVL